MTPSFEDDIYSQQIQVNASESLIDCPIDFWEEITYIQGTSILKSLQELLPSVTYRRGFAQRVIENLYYYNSKVEILKNRDSRILLILREAEVVLDLFNYKREWFAKEDDIKKVLREIGCESFVYISLEEAEQANNILCQTNKKNNIKTGIVSYGTSMFGKDLWKVALTTMFHGEHNWVCGNSYIEMIGHLQERIYPLEVICYERTSYYRIEDTYLIESNKSEILEELETNPVAIFSCNHQSPSDVQLLFHGQYEFDKARSLKDGCISFKRIKNSIEF